MRATFIFFMMVLCVSGAVYAQPAATLTVRTMAQYDSLGIKIIKQAYPPPREGSSQQIDYYLLANGMADSIWFCYALGSIDYHGISEQCKVSLRQLDGQGQPEIILEYSEYSSNRSSTSTYIFNPDSKRRIFAGQNNFFSMYIGEQVATCKGYAYTLTFDAAGNLIIRYPNEPCMEPGHKKGVYTLVNGEYIWVKEK